MITPPPKPPERPATDPPPAVKSQVPARTGPASASERPGKTSEILASTLRVAIVNGTLLPGDHLPSEAALIADHGVSRPSVREALRILESEGLLKVARGRTGGAEVLHPGLDFVARSVTAVLQYRHTSLADVFRARTQLEAPCARLIIESGNKQAVDILAQELEFAEQFLDDADKYTVWDWKFHLRVSELAGNQTIHLIMQMLYRIIENANKAFAHTVDPEVSKVSTLLAHHSHQRLVKILRTCDADEAEAFWTQHLYGAGQHLLAYIPATTVVELMQ